MKKWPSDVVAQVRLAADAAAADATGDVLEALAPDVTEHRLASPAEVVFFAWWRVANRNADVVLELVPQMTVTVGSKRYRLDFTVRPRDVELCQFLERCRLVPRVAIEVDGHGFHERTREQVADRNERDADLQRSGWLVLHYSGSQIWEDPRKCADDAHCVVSAQYRHALTLVLDAVARQS